MTLILHSLINFLRLRFKINKIDGLLKKHGKLPCFKIAIIILNGCTVPSTVTQIVLMHPSQIAILQINENYSLTRSFIHP